MQKSLPTVKIYQIERVQNLVAYHKYLKEKEILESKHPHQNFKIMKRLFHGTRGTDPTQIMKSDEGFDMRFSNAGLWGTGIYFAENAKYSHEYAYQDYKDTAIGIKQMFLAKVLIGDSISLVQNRSLKYPPYIEGQEERYDSVNGITKDTKVYIVYDNGK